MGAYLYRGLMLHFLHRPGPLLLLQHSCTIWISLSIPVCISLFFISDQRIFWFYCFLCLVLYQIFCAGYPFLVIYTYILVCIYQGLHFYYPMLLMKSIGADFVVVIHFRLVL